MQQKNSVKELVANAISKVAGAYLEKYPDNIVGIYLCPFKVGGKQRIDLVILHNCRENLTPVKKELKINELKIIVSIKSSYDYQGKADTETKIQANKDLKNSIIIYDNKHHSLENKKKALMKQEEILFYNNSYELPKELVKQTKSKVYSLRKK